MTAKRTHEAQVDRVIAKAVDRDGAENYDLYSDDELVVLRSRICVQVVENGGFGFLFEHPLPLDDDYKQTLSALEQIGALGAAETLREAIEQFPSGLMPLDPLERAVAYQAVPEATRCRLDDQFLEQTPEIARCAASYIRSRALDVS